MRVAGLVGLAGQTIISLYLATVELGVLLYACRSFKVLWLKRKRAGYLVHSFLTHTRAEFNKSCLSLFYRVNITVHIMKSTEWLARPPLC